MGSNLVQQLIDYGIHFGHKASRWHPTMKPFILGKRNAVHLIDIKETVRGLLQAKKYVSRIVSQGKDVLFVGTKRQARLAIQACAHKCDMHYVSERWLGGTLTNFRTIRSRLTRLEELEQLEQSGQLFTESKKTISRLTREKKKILRNLEGIRKMSKLPGVVVVIDANHEYNAVYEAKKLHIPTVCLLDTDSDPAMADIPIPGNDDAMRAIELVLEQLAEAAMAGKRIRPEETQQDADTQPRKRSRRPTTTQLADQQEDWSEEPQGTEGVKSTRDEAGEEDTVAAVADPSAQSDNPTTS